MTAPALPGLAALQEEFRGDLAVGEMTRDGAPARAFCTGTHPLFRSLTTLGTTKQEAIDAMQAEIARRQAAIAADATVAVEEGDHA